MARSKARGGTGTWVPYLFLSLTLGVICLALVSGSPHFTGKKLYHHLASPLLRLLLYMGVGLLVGQVIESLGWAGKLGGWARPLWRWGHLKEESGASCTAAFFSGIMANTMLMTFYQEGKLSRREMTLSYLLNSGLPVYLLHLPTTFFIIFPLTRQAGLIYLALTGAAAVLRSAALLVYSRWLLPAGAAGLGEQGCGGGGQGHEAPAPSPTPPPPTPYRGIGEQSMAMTQDSAKEKLLSEIWRKFQRRFARVVLYTLPIYVLIFLLNDWGLFRWLREAAASYVVLGFLPMEAASVVIFSVAAEFTSGMAAAGAFLQAGALTVPQTVMALILGNIVATPIRAVRHQLPSHAGIFSPKLGTELLLLSQGMRVLSLLLVAIPYGMWG